MQRMLKSPVAAASSRQVSASSPLCSARPSSTSSSRRDVIARADAMCRDVIGERRNVESQGKVFKVTFIAAGGEERVVDCPDNVYILDAAEDAGLDLPATCRGGICGACVARVTSGKADQSDVADLDFTVSPDEQAQGMTLLCMARATTDLSVETQADWGYSLGVGEWKGATGRFSAKPDPLMGKEWTELQQKEAAAAAAAANK